MINVTALHPVDKTAPHVRTHIHAREDADGTSVDSSALRAYVERAARLHEERKALAEDIADIYAEAASNGFDKASLRDVVRIFTESPDKRQKRVATDDMTAAYLVALGLAQ